MIYLKADDEISEFDGQEVLIFPLKKDELELLKENKDNFAKYINLTYEAEDLSNPQIENLYKNQYTLLCEYPDSWVFHTFWVVVSITKRTIVGLINYKNMPSVDGGIEVYCNIGKNYQKQGYATIALELLENYSKSVKISRLNAFVKKDDLASIKLLERSKFSKIYEDEKNYYWEKELV